MLSNPADGRSHVLRPAKPNHLVKNVQAFDGNDGRRLYALSVEAGCGQTTMKFGKTE